jgi:uncharacterized protein YndB with AHSA1/START domain
MNTATQASVTTQVYSVYIKATPEAIWDAITSPEWTARYGYGGTADFDLRPGGIYRHYPSDEMRKAGEAMGYTTPDVIVDGEVIESEPPRKLVLDWRMLMDPRTAAEGSTRLTYEISESKGGVSKLTVIHDLEGAPTLATIVSGSSEEVGAGGGWTWVLSDLKSLLETGTSMDPHDALNQS